MPTIISKGRLPGDRRYRKTCGNCGTVFEFFHKETRAVESRDERDSGKREISCPLDGCRRSEIVRAGEEVFSELATLSPLFAPGVHSVLTERFAERPPYCAYRPERD